ncbi:hypothetical protein C8D93_1331 [Sinimarinibacterium flocculans]|uniref:Uncharacterized protein n=1 Tax=Sinimarinibacterium flocculans TaxID=985250 RepID=A0A318E3J5_9GAMM|nr:hypothetical protein C8D93_1331 [Sinimarinibacterium flocculans]
MAKIRRVRRSTLGHIGLLLSKDQVSARTGQLQDVLSDRVLATSPGVFDPLFDEERASILAQALEYAVNIVATIRDEREIDGEGFKQPSREEIEAALRKELLQLESETALRMANDLADWASGGEEIPKHYY